MDEAARTVLAFGLYLSDNAARTYGLGLDHVNAMIDQDYYKKLHGRLRHDSYVRYS